MNIKNLQNIPSSGSEYAKLIKGCFRAPPGWIMLGADFASLEDRISALTTKDPNKLKIYIEGIDGHSFKAFYYWPDKLPGIINTVESINSIAKLFPNVRQDSKPCTFLLTYQGTYHGLMQNIGFSEVNAKAIEKNYHDLYKVSDDWVASRIQNAADIGYVTCAFGLRLRTPVLQRTILGNQATPYKAKSESRTAGNALGQSYGLLNNRAAIEFQRRTIASKHALDIKPIALIHDALYYIVRDTVGCVEWVNNNLIECMEWNDLPEIQHPIVKLGAELELFHPSWAESIEIPNKASKREILNIIKERK